MKRELRTPSMRVGSAKLRSSGIFIIGLCCFLRMTGEWNPAGGGGPTAKQCGAIHSSSSGLWCCVPDVIPGSIFSVLSVPYFQKGGCLAPPVWRCWDLDLILNPKLWDRGRIVLKSAQPGLRML